MSPAAVGLLTTGRAKWYSQRVTGRPFLDCMFAALCSPLSYMGYDLPEMFVARLRAASGVPPDKPTSTADSRTALRELLPDAEVYFGGLDDDELLRRLAEGEICVRVMVRNPLLPLRLRRFVGRNWPGIHAVALGGARRQDDGEFEVLWMDPMGLPRDTYNGEFVAYSGIRDALLRTPLSGLVRVTYGMFNAALEDGPEASISGVDVLPVDAAPVLTRARVDEWALVLKGTPFRHPQTREPVLRAVRDGEFRLAGRTIDRRFFGAWVNTRRMPGAKGLTLLLVERERVGRPFIRR